ncbi:MAG: hypothetical protein WBO97_11325 [Tepidiformaceae bacterium]
MFCSDPFQLSNPEDRFVDVLRETRGMPVVVRLRALASFEFPAPGQGRTRFRYQRLAEVAADDLSLARLVEGHFDAQAIIAESGLAPEQDRVFAVWVAGQPLKRENSDDTITLNGRKQYCSGYGMTDRALVDASDGSGTFLYLVDARAPSPLPQSWPSVGMSDSASLTLDFEALNVIGPVGNSGFYQDRPGFWNGSGNVAACWYGGALGLARRAKHAAENRPDSYGIAGEMAVHLSQMRHALMQTADDIDSCPSPAPEVREARALVLRDIVYRGCNAVYALALELGGTSLSTHCAEQGRALADLPIYLRQFHPTRDRTRLGQLLTTLEDGGSSGG